MNKLKNLLYLIVIVISLSSCNTALKYRYALNISGNVENTKISTNFELNNTVYSNIDVLNYYQSKQVIQNIVSTQDQQKAHKFIDDMFDEILNPFLTDPSIRYKLFIKGICRDRSTGIYIPIDIYITNF